MTNGSGIKSCKNCGSSNMTYKTEVTSCKQFTVSLNCEDCKKGWCVTEPQTTNKEMLTQVIL